MRHFIRHPGYSSLRGKGKPCGFMCLGNPVPFCLKWRCERWGGDTASEYRWNGARANPNPAKIYTKVYFKVRIWGFTNVLASPRSFKQMKTPQSWTLEFSFPASYCTQVRNIAYRDPGQSYCQYRELEALEALCISTIWPLLQRGKHWKSHLRFWMSSDIFCPCPVLLPANVACVKTYPAGGDPPIHDSP